MVLTERSVITFSYGRAKVYMLTEIQNAKNAKGAHAEDAKNAL